MLGLQHALCPLIAQATTKRVSAACVANTTWPNVAALTFARQYDLLPATENHSINVPCIHIPKHATGQCSTLIRRPMDEVAKCITYLREWQKDHSFVDPTLVDAPLVVCLVRHDPPSSGGGVCASSACGAVQTSKERSSLETIMRFNNLLSPSTGCFDGAVYIGILENLFRTDVPVPWSWQHTPPCRLSMLQLQTSVQSVDDVLDAKTVLDA